MKAIPKGSLQTASPSGFSQGNKEKIPANGI